MGPPLGRPRRLRPRRCLYRDPYRSRRAPTLPLQPRTPRSHAPHHSTIHVPAILIPSWRSPRGGRPVWVVNWRGHSELVRQWMSSPSGPLLGSFTNPATSRSGSGVRAALENRTAKGQRGVQGQERRPRPTRRPPPAAADRAQGSHQATSSPIDAEADDAKASDMGAGRLLRRLSSMIELERH